MAKKEDTLTDKIVGEVIREQKPGMVTLESKGLLDHLSDRLDETVSPQKTRVVRDLWLWLLDHCRLLRGLKRRLDVPGNRGLRFFLLVATVFMMLVLTIWYAIFFINDVILFESDFQINEQGTVNPRKSLDGEYALFLFNTSEIWANPGIQVNKNDRLRISISGGFHSAIDEALDGASENVRPKYSWEAAYKNEKWEREWSLPYCLSGDQKNFSFGTVMYTIQPESADIRNHPLKVPKEEIHAWKPGVSSFTAKESGYLYFAVNDLIFDDLESQSVEERIEEYYCKDTSILVARKTELEKYLRDYPNDADSLMALKDIDEELKSVGKEKAAVQKDPQFLYKDNLGQLLVAVDIQHPITSFWHWPEGVFRWFDNHFEWFSYWIGKLKTILYTPVSSLCWVNWIVSVLCVVLLCTGAIFLFFIFGFCNLLVFGIWTAILCVAISLVYLLFRWLLSRISP